MAAAGIILIMLLGGTLVLTAVKPDLPLIRSSYWWRLPSRTRPTLVERVPVAVLGLFLLLFGVYEITLLLR